MNHLNIFIVINISRLIFYVYVTQLQLMRLFAVKLNLSYEQKCKVRSKFFKNLSLLKNKLGHKFYEFMNSN